MRFYTIWIACLNQVRTYWVHKLVVGVVLNENLTHSIWKLIKPVKGQLKATFIKIGFLKKYYNPFKSKGCYKWTKHASFFLRGVSDTKSFLPFHTLRHLEKPSYLQKLVLVLFNLHLYLHIYQTLTIYSVVWFVYGCCRGEPPIILITKMEIPCMSHSHS